jgi:hypothetical protein
MTSPGCCSYRARLSYGFFDEITTIQCYKSLKCICYLFQVKYIMDTQRGII